MLKEFLFEWIPWIMNETARIVEITQRVIMAGYREATVEKKWLLLHSIAIPVSSAVFPDTSSSTIKWKVTLNPTRFTDSSNTSYFTHSSYLGLSIHAGNIVLDLTDWVNEVQWSGSVEPTPLELFTIWCCDTGNSYLHLVSTAEAELITEKGDILRKALV